MTAACEERGVALVAALLAILLMSALCGALVLTTTVETTIAGNYLRVEQGRSAAEAVLERAVADLALASDWTPVLAGERLSAFTDGPPSGTRALGDGSLIDLEIVASMASCQRARPCTLNELTRATATRPWGANNPVWRIYAYGRMASFAPGGDAPSDYYVVAMVGDDPSETDDDPLADGGGSGQAGLGVVVVRGQAFGPRGVRRVVEATVSRGVAGGVRTVSWRAQTSGT